jgi:rhamnosyltransferase subunit B
MKVVIFAGGTDGDVHPQLGIARALVLRGHQVTVLTTYNHIDMVRRCGFRVIDLFSEEDMNHFMLDIKGMNSIKKIRYYRRFISSTVATWCDLVADQIDSETVMVAPSGFSLIARLLQQKYGTPYVTTLLAPSYILFLSVKEPAAFKALGWYRALPYQLRKPALHVLERLVLDPLLQVALKDSAAKLGMPLPSRIASQWQYSPQKILGLFYGWFSPPPDDWPSQIMLTGFPLFGESTGQGTLSPRLENFLEAGSPPITFTPGTGVKDCRAFFNIAVEALQQLGQRGIFLTRATDQIPDLPATVLHEEYLPLDVVLPRASALVHHGGIGTTAQALFAGTPQLLMPGHSDQFDNARLVEQLGCGMTLRKRSSAASLADNLRHLITAPEIKEKCRIAQSRMEPGAVACDRAADEVEQTFRTAHAAV